MHDWNALKANIRRWGAELGLTAIGFASPDLGTAETGLRDWLAAGCHGAMDYMAAHGTKRARPAELLPGTQAVIVCRIDYLPATERAVSVDYWHRNALPAGCDPTRPQQRERPEAGDAALNQAGQTGQAIVSRYAQGRDYHKLLRQRLQKLADRMQAELGGFMHRAFVDSAPVMEVELAQRAGLGWRGKHTLLLSRSGSWFFLGELFVDLPIPPDTPGDAHCGNCRACLDICPTQAITAPYRLDARRCISYLTIEHPDSIPLEFRPLLGQRIYGCDDCQSICPWNRFAVPSREADFQPRQGLDRATLAELFAWRETDFNERLAGSPIRRIGHERWLRNIAVALGNAAPTPENLAALHARQDHPAALVREHVAWALERLNARMELLILKVLDHKVDNTNADNENGVGVL